MALANLSQPKLSCDFGSLPGKVCQPGLSEPWAGDVV